MGFYNGSTRVLFGSEKLHSGSKSILFLCGVLERFCRVSTRFLYGAVGFRVWGPPIL